MFSEDIDFIKSYCKDYNLNKRNKNEIIFEKTKKLLKVLKMQMNTKEINDKVIDLENLLYKTE